MRREDFLFEWYGEAVTVIHLPTGTVAGCGDFKTRLRNKVEAIRRVLELLEGELKAA
jgi:protein subunit release factor A